MFLDGFLVVNNDGIRQANSRLCATQRLVSGKHEIYVIGFAAYLDSELEVTYSGPDTHSVRTIIGGKTFARVCDPRNAISSPNTFTLCTFKSEPTSVYMGNCQPTVGIAHPRYPGPCAKAINTTYYSFDHFSGGWLVPALGSADEIWVRNQ